MRVVMILPNHAPHFGRYWAEAAAEVADVITLEFVPRLTLPRRAPNVGANGRTYQVERFDLRPSRVMMPAAARVLARRVDRALTLAERDHGRIDLLHTHYYHQTPFVRHLHGRYPYVHTEHSPALLVGALGDRAHYPLSRAGMRIARRGLGAAECVIAVSECLAQSMGELGLPGDPFVVIPNPVDAYLFRPTRDRDPELIVSVGRLAVEKQPELVLRGFAEVQRLRPSLRLEFIGDGPMRGELQRLITSSNLDGAVSFTGRLPREGVAERVARARAYVNAAKVESFGVAVAEALVAGTPVVAPNVAAVGELVTPRNGVLVKPDDAAAIADGIVSILSVEYDHLAIADDAAARYSTVAVGQALGAVYQAAI